LSQRYEVPDLDRTDYVLALVVGIGALAVYVRTLAPDVLYSDSAEFQTLAYTLGMTHSTGYPIYLLLARLLGCLPLGSLAWRVNLLSAVSAAVTLSAVFLLVRYVTRSRMGALLGVAALGLSYTFWSQAVIAEVYTPGLAFLSVIVLLLWHWHKAPLGRSRALLFATMLFGLGLGVHAFVGLIAPTAALFVIWTLWSWRGSAPQWRRSLGSASLGLVLGLGVFLLAFFLVDVNNPPTSFYQVALVSSRSIWGLSAADLDTPFERFVATFTGLQWRDAMFPGGDDFFWEALGRYAERVLTQEFTWVLLLLALLGLEVTLRRLRRLGVFVLVTFVTTLYFVLNYEPPDKYIFYLPTYLFVAIAIGAGAGVLLDLVYRQVAVRKSRLYLVVYLLIAVTLAVVVLKPYGDSRWEALRSGAATFVQEEYAYPLYDLGEPRRTASWQLRYLPENAVLIMEWRALYTLYYLAHVEQRRTDITIKEASPYGGEGMVAESLVQELKDALQEGRPVYTDRVYGGLREQLRVQPALGGEWYGLSLPKAD
jgi:4-amino-4-deoxy-L-arabinose transferase-like glycosyltransferase